MICRSLVFASTLLVATACGGDDSTASGSESEGTTRASTGSSPAATSGGAMETEGQTSEAPTTVAPTTTAADSTGSAAGGSVCRYRCETAPDCFVEGADIQLTCDEGDCITTCETAPDCVASASGWTFAPCETNRECPGGACVDYGTSTGCGRAPSAQVDCVAQGLEEVDATDVDGNGVTVCGLTTWSCEAGRCSPPTADCEDAGCLEGLTCSADGRCICDTDEACLLAGLGNACQLDGTCATACEDLGACGGLTFAFDGGGVVCE